MTFIAYSAIHFVYTWRGDLLASLPTNAKRSSGEVFQLLTWTECTHRCRSPHCIGIHSVACSGLGKIVKINKFAMILSLFANLRRTLYAPGRLWGNVNNTRAKSKVYRLSTPYRNVDHTCRFYWFGSRPGTSISLVRHTRHLHILCAFSANIWFLPAKIEEKHPKQLETNLGSIHSTKSCGRALTWNKPACMLCLLAQIPADSCTARAQHIHRTRSPSYISACTLRQQSFRSRRCTSIYSAIRNYPGRTVGSIRPRKPWPFHRMHSRHYIYMWHRRTLHYRNLESIDRHHLKAPKKIA